MEEYQLQRSRNGCLTCRGRRVKCDEVRPLCGRCRLGSRECAWGPEKPPNPRKRRRRMPAGLSLAATPAQDSPVLKSQVDASGSGSVREQGKAGGSGGTDPSGSPQGGRGRGQGRGRDHGDRVVSRSGRSNSPSGRATPSDSRSRSRSRSRSASASVSASASRSPVSRLLVGGSSKVSVFSPTAHGRDAAGAGAGFGFGVGVGVGVGETEMTVGSSRASCRPSPAGPPDRSGVRPIEALLSAVDKAEQERPRPPHPRASGSAHSLFSHGQGIEWISTATHKRLMMDPTFLQTYFPRMDEMLTFRHYISTVEELMAFSTPHSPFNPWVSIHAPLAFQHAPGESAATDALRTAILAVGAVRLRFADDPTNPRAAHRITTDARARVLGLLEPVLDRPDAYPAEVETTFAALLSLIISSSLAADDGWDALLHSVVTFIDKLGGPAKLLSAAPRKHYSVTRFVLEQLAIRDVVACMTIGRRPSIIRQPFEPWFFEIERWSGRDVEWESVERMFGVTRGMVDVMARACTLVGISRETSAREQTSPPRELQDAANGLLAELAVGDYGLNFRPYHSRTQYGNLCFRYAMRIALLRDVLGLGEADDEVVRSARYIIELARELEAQFGMMNWLLWPLLLAGFHLGSDHAAREPLLELVEHPGPHMCFDTRAAIGFLKEYWRHEDEGKGARSLTHWQVSGGELHRRLFAG